LNVRKEIRIWETIRQDAYRIELNTDRTFGAPLITAAALTAPVSSFFNLLLLWFSFSQCQFTDLASIILFDWAFNNHSSFAIIFNAHMCVLLFLTFFLVSSVAPTPLIKTITTGVSVVLCLMSVSLVFDIYWKTRPQNHVLLF